MEYLSRPEGWEVHEVTGEDSIPRHLGMVNSDLGSRDLSLHLQVYGKYSVR